MKKIEYRVIEVSRYVVTRYCSDGNAGSCETKGEFDNWDMAYSVAYALCSHEHQELGYPHDSPHVTYPAAKGGLCSKGAADKSVS